MKSSKYWVVFLSILFVTALFARPLPVAGEDADSGDLRPDRSQQAGRGTFSVSEMMEQADDLVRNAENRYAAGDLADFEIAADLYEQVASQQPENFEANWKTAKACRLYGEEGRKREIAHWEDICAEYGRKGMFYAQRAIELSPDKVEGYFYYGLCAGTYSDGVGIFTALREGLKGEVQRNLEKAYSIDKYYEQGGPIVALGRFWQLVPWPYNDEDKAMELYREIQQTRYFGEKDNVEVRIYMAEILMGQWGGESKEEARQLLEEVPKMTGDPYWIERAETLRNEL